MIRSCPMEKGSFRHENFFAFLPVAILCTLMLAGLPEILIASGPGGHGGGGVPSRGGRSGGGGGFGIGIGIQIGGPRMPAEVSDHKFPDLQKELRSSDDKPQKERTQKQSGKLVDKHVDSAPLRKMSKPPRALSRRVGNGH